MSRHRPAPAPSGIGDDGSGAFDGAELDAAVVAVLHDSDDVVDGFLESLPAGMAPLRWHAVLVDSGSTAGVPARVRDRPGTTVVELGRNVGFGAGVNAGVAAAPPHRAVLVLNPDTRLEPGCGAALAAALAHDGVGIAVPCLRGADGTLARSLRREPTVARALGEALAGGSIAGRTSPTGEVVMSSRRYLRDGDAEWASGAAWMIDRQCWDLVGGFDPSFFLYWEEVDFALRARDAGQRLRYVAGARAVHLGGASNVDPALYALLMSNRARGYARRHGRAASAVYRASLLAGEAARAATGRPTSRAALRALLGDGTVLPPAATAAGVGAITSQALLPDRRRGQRDGGPGTERRSGRT